MKEAIIRKWHRRMGITLALFIILQAVSGIILTLDWFETSPSHTHIEGMNKSDEVSNSSHASQGEATWYEAIELAHHGTSSTMKGYRILLGIGLVGMVLSGSTLFYKIKKRATQ
jgi:hypothetical protein